MERLDSCFMLCDVQDWTEDTRVYWEVNHLRFRQHFRDQALIAAVASRMDNEVCISLLHPFSTASTNLVVFSCITKLQLSEREQHFNDVFVIARDFVYQIDEWMLCSGDSTMSFQTLYSP